MFKKISKGNLDYDNISRLLYGTPDKAGALAKINNNTDGDIIVPANEVLPAEGEGIRCNIDGKLFERFQYSLLLDLLGAVRGCVFDYEEHEETQSFKMGQRVCLYEDSKLFLKGYIANIYPTSDSGGVVSRMEIKSSAGILLDTVVPPPCDFLYMSVRTIIQTICDYFGLEVEFSDDPELDYVTNSDIGNSFSAQEGETCWDFIVRIANSRGLLVDDDGTKLKVGRIQDSEPVMSLVEGAAVGVYEWHSNFQTDNLARYYLVYAQNPAGASAVAEIPFDLPITKSEEIFDAYDSDLQNNANWLACRSIGEAFKIELAVNDFLGLQKGQMVIVQAPSCKIYDETKMIVEEMYEDSQEGNSIVLTLPCAYTGQIPESLPLC